MKTVTHLADKYFNHNMAVRLFKPSDLKEVHEVYTRANVAAGTSPLIISDGIDKYLKDPSEFHSPENNKYVLVATWEAQETGGKSKIVGICKCAPASDSDSTTTIVSLELDCVSVDPIFQRRGVGTALIKAAQELTDAVSLSVFHKNDVAIAFYKSCDNLDLTETREYVSSRDGTKYSLLTFKTC
jgi:ribosomal protein S18 acetylase RimI-like enzyme